MWQRTEPRPTTVARSQRPPRPAAGRAAARWSGAARALVLAADGRRAWHGGRPGSAAPVARASSVRTDARRCSCCSPSPWPTWPRRSPTPARSRLRTAGRRRSDCTAWSARAPAVRDTVATGSPRPRRRLALLRRPRTLGRATRPLTTAPCRSTSDRASGSALVGPSGSGKSTVAALLLRFLDPEQRPGDDRRGAGCATLSLDDVRRRVGLVDDDPHVFATTLVENVRLARPDASDAEVDDALRRARLGPWLDALPDGPGHLARRRPRRRVRG